MEAFEQFLKQYRVQKFSKSEIVLVQGEVPRCAYVIKKGILKTYNLTSQGEEKPISFDMPGEVIPLTWVFSKLKHSQYYYEAFTDCELYCVPVQDYIDFIRVDVNLTFAALEQFVVRYMHFQMRVNALEQSKAASKVLNTIHFLCIKFGVDMQKDVVKIQLPLTQQDLANFMGLTRETTGIELKKLQRKGILTYKRQNYIVKTNLLNELLDEDYEPGRVEIDQPKID